MRKLILAAIIAVLSVTNVFAQKRVEVEVVEVNGKQGYFIPADQPSTTTSMYLSKKLNNLPAYQSVDVERRVTKGDTTIVTKLGGKGAEAFGHGLELYAGAGFMDNAVNSGLFITPEVGLRYRYDWRYVSFGVGASALYRQYNSEAIDAGKKYVSYAADATFHVNLLNLGQSEHIINVFGQGGYLFGKHRKAIAQMNNTPLVHNGSGLTYGGGIEYRWQIHRTGNALIIRGGYKHQPTTFVNDTHRHGLVYIHAGFNFGIKRYRVNNLKY
jgi:hypothetical protein